LSGFPALTGGNNYFPPSYGRRTGLLYIPAFTMCNESTLDQEAIKKGIFFSRISKQIERDESDLVMIDPPRGKETGALDLSEHQWRGHHRRRPGIHKAPYKAQAAPTARPKVPMRRRGADCPVVVMKRGNARGAKGAGHRR
jgi:hypothetical protein